MYIQQSVYGCLMVVYRFGIQLPPPPLSPRVVWSKLSLLFVFPVTASLLAPPLVFIPWIYGRGWSGGPPPAVAGGPVVVDPVKGCVVRGGPGARIPSRSSPLLLPLLLPV